VKKKKKKSALHTAKEKEKNRWKRWFSPKKKGKSKVIFESDGRIGLQLL